MTYVLQCKLADRQKSRVYWCGGESVWTSRRHEGRRFPSRLAAEGAAVVVLDEMPWSVPRVVPAK